MFTTARITLTIWYLLIIMLISIMFSFSIYHILTNELDRSFHRITQRYSQEFGALAPQMNPQLLEPSYLQASEDRIQWILIYVNCIIFGVSGIGGYILAGFTLRPIKQMMDEQNRFVTDVSHELRTPITSLKSEIEVYLRSKHRTKEEADALLVSNLEEVNNLHILSDNLIQLVREQKSQRHVSTPISLQHVLQMAMKKTEKLAKQKNISIKKPTRDLRVKGDKDSLSQVFAILLDNAIKYSPKKTVITITIHMVDDKAAIQITDQGMGIEEAAIPHIFDRFYRADISRTKQEIPGYGLGLSIAKKIITEHHGHIAVKSILGNKTTFTVFLPLEK